MTIIKKNVRLLGLCVLPVVLAACSGLSQPKVAKESNVSYGDAKAVETTSIEFGSTDLQLIAEKMTQSMLESPVLTGRPTMALGAIKNKTSEYIDTKNITSSIQTALLKSGKVRFVRGMDEMQQGVDQLQMQNQSGLYKKSTAAKVGNMIAAKYQLEGEFTSIVKQNKSVKDVFYKFTLKMYDIEQGTIEWEEEKEIRKSAQK